MTAKKGERKSYRAERGAYPRNNKRGRKDGAKHGSAHPFIFRDKTVFFKVGNGFRPDGATRNHADKKRVRNDAAHGENLLKKRRKQF